MKTAKLCMLAVVLAIATAAFAAEQTDLFSDLIRQGAEWLQESSLEDILAGVELPVTEDWEWIWETAEGLLSTGSLESLAQMLPDLEAMLEGLSSVPGAGPYADWLRQRMDYFEVADEVVRPPARAPSAPAPVPAPVQPPAPPSLTAPRTPSYPIPEKPDAPAVRDERMWKRRVASRPPPHRAVEMIPTLKQVFVEEGIPPEWVWLAEVESSLNPRARSPAGAVGLFQFMPETARRFGLSTAGPDDRTHPTKSARAAARYLRVLHGQFGSWPLALAAYNAGEGRVGRTLKKHQGQSFEEIAGRLPLQTQMYVPKVMATVALRESVDPHSLPPPLAATFSR